MGIRKVNLSDLKGSLSQRGRERFHDDELHQAFMEAIEMGGDTFVWETAQVEGKSEKARTASKAKWRSRATSLFSTLETEMTISVRWTDANEMVIIISEPVA